jgi:hypothetical protein
MRSGHHHNNNKIIGIFEFINKNNFALIPFWETNTQKEVNVQRDKVICNLIGFTDISHVWGGLD